MFLFYTKTVKHLFDVSHDGDRFLPESQKDSQEAEVRASEKDVVKGDLLMYGGEIENPPDLVFLLGVINSKERQEPAFFLFAQGRGQFRVFFLEDSVHKGQEMVSL